MAVAMNSQTIGRRNQDIPIDRWEVWFQTPYGLFEKVEDAITKVKSADLDPDNCVIPVAVAIGCDDSYEIVVRT